MRSNLSLRVIFVCLLSVALLHPGGASADEPKETPKSVLKKGKKQLEDGQFQQALETFQGGYQEYSDPEFLFFSGYAYLKLQRYQQAKDTFEEYLQLKPKSNNRGEIEKLIGDLEVILTTRIKLSSTPDGAAIWIDSQDGPSLGLTPIEIATLPGEHTLILQKSGYGLTKAPFVAKEGETTTLSVPLDPAPTRLKADTKPGGAEILLDGASIGFSPFQGDIKPGKHTLVFKKAGYGDLTIPIEGRSGKDLEISEKMPALPAVVVFSDRTQGATLKLDGKNKGAVPERLELTPGEHTISITAKGHRPLSQDLNLTPGQETKINAQLQKSSFSLMVEAPDNSTVSVNGKIIGTTPLQAPLSFDEDAKPVIEISKEGFKPYQKKLSGKDGDYSLTVDLKEPGIPVAPLAILGLSVGAASAGAVFGVKALKNDDIFAKTPSPELLETIQKQAILSDIGLGIGAAGAVVGVILFQKSGGFSESPGKLAPQVSIMPSGKGAVAQISF